MKTILLTIVAVLFITTASFAQTNIIGETIEVKSNGSVGSSYGSTGAAYKAPSYGSTGSSYGSMGSAYKATVSSYGSTGNKLFSGKVRSKVRSRANKVTNKVTDVTPVFRNDAVTQHLIEDHRVPANYVYSLNARERQDLHDRLHR